MAPSRLILLCLCVVLTGCGATQDSSLSHAEKRRQQLLEVYPIGKATRGDVAKSLRRPAESAFGRPAAGWEAEPDWVVRSYAARAENRINRQIAKLERYFGTDGSSQCYYWFYYDSQDLLLDTEWQWISESAEAKIW